MKIDWKKVSKTPGYVSLKAAYIRDVQEAAKSQDKGYHPMRSKKEFLEHFRWVIGRAEHYAHHKNTTIDVILNEWEDKRTYWWLNYYQNNRQPLLNRSSVCLPPSIKLLRKNKRYSRYPKKYKQKAIFSELLRLQEINSTKSPKRWKMIYKKGRLVTKIKPTK